MPAGIFAATLLILAVVAPHSGAAPVRTGHAEAELVSEAVSVAPGDSFRVALRLKPDPGWHVYWKNPGDAGLPPKLDWTLPSGWRADSLRFPYPTRIETPPFASYGYKGEVGYPSWIAVSPGAVAGQRVSLRAKAEWLICADECLPESAELSVEIAVGETRANEARREWWNDLTAKLPVPAPAWNWRAALGETSLRLSWHAPGGAGPGEVLFFPEAQGVIGHAAPQRLVIEEGRFVLEASRDEVVGAEPDTLRGVLVASEGWDVEGTRRPALAVAIVPGETPENGTAGIGTPLLLGLFVLVVLALIILMKRPHVQRSKP